VVVVGDTHGQLHDALKLMSIAGEPSATNWYVFNGDFVDRGAWGAELFAVVLAWKAAAPDFVFLLRGNHECEFCTEVYGYKRELQVKYSKASGNALWRQFMRVGAELPLAAQIGDKTLVLHGGLFRGKKRRGRGASSRALAVGTLAELAGAWKGGDDPDGEGDAAIAGDVLWSDPAPADQVTGLVPNENRGIGTMFGPDATAEFLKTNGLSLVLRSHEGPDAREDREGMDNMHAGFSVDHDIENVGKLCTVFSAPDYPQFIEAGDTRHNNAATFVRLRGDTAWAEPEPTAFSAARPRPESEPYYDITVGGSDEEGPDGELARETRAAASGDEAGREETTALEEEAGPEAAAAAEAMEAEDDEGPTPSSQEDTEEIPSWPRSRPR
jgi:serine/threonine-protein phosphatase 5